MGRALVVAGLALSAALIAANPVAASGDGFPVPWYLDPFGGEAKDQAAFYQGRVGVIMVRGPRSRLFMAWRLLHAMKVGPEAGVPLSVPCCDGPRRDYRVPSPPTARDLWLEARKAVAPTSDLSSRDLPVERDGPNFTSAPNCFDDAFRIATDALKDRVRLYGGSSADVRAWLSSQDHVFRACRESDVALPSLSANAPAWLKADRAYQLAALDFYSDRLPQAAGEFRAIADDQTNPWRPWGLYLQARALERQALDHPSPIAAAAAKKAIEDLSKGPDDAIGKAKVRDLSHILSFRYEPAGLASELDGDLLEAALPKDANVLFRDYSDLIDQGAAQTDVADWMTTLVAKPLQKRIDDDDGIAASAKLGVHDEAYETALRHARKRWTTTKDRAWLLAALTLADPTTAAARALLIDAKRVKPDYPGWLTIQYHLIRLSLHTSDPAVLRARLDAVLARLDLSTSDRNIFRALRLQVAADPQDFVRWALRRRVCGQTGFIESGCVRDDWESVVQLGPFDQNRRQGSTGLGEDARAIIDRMPLADRIALSRDPALPEKIRMDIALTSFARALQLQDDASLDALATELAPLLPQLAEEWRRIPLAKPGPDKRFAVDMVMAKIPGLRVDLVDYERPAGRVVDFQSHWMDWLILPSGQGRRDIRSPPVETYQTAGVTIDSRADLACLGECGRGAQPLRLPDFVQNSQDKATAERAFFVQRGDTEEGVYDPVAQKRRPVPPGPAAARSVWDEMLDYAKAHPNDPRIPEALHWIVHASHFGGSHNESGRRAFQLLHLRYPHSIWARRTKVYTE